MPSNSWIGKALRCIGNRRSSFLDARAWRGLFSEACIDEERERVAGLMRNASLGIPWKVVAGGALRQDSVRNGLSALPDDCMEVLIHDAARPFVSPVLVNRILDGLHGEASGECVAACIPGIPVVDTIKVMDEEKKVVATPDRKHLMAVQTPQGFSLAFLRAAHQRAEQEGWVVTDDASSLELCGHAVHVAEGGKQKNYHARGFGNVADDRRAYPVCRLRV